MTRYIEIYRARFGVEPICRVLGVSASAYYQRMTGKRSQRVVDDERMLALIRELHLANYEAYGSRRMWKALGRAGHQVGRDSSIGDIQSIEYEQRYHEQAQQQPLPGTPSAD